MAKVTQLVIRAEHKPGTLAQICSALEMEPFMPCEPSVRTRFAPNAFSTLRRSMDMVSGIVSVIG